jgi:hypothetical protein
MNPNQPIEPWWWADPEDEPELDPELDDEFVVDLQPDYCHHELN